MLREVQSQQTKALYEFGMFRLDTQEGVLYAEGAEVHMTPKALQTLIFLVEQNNHIIGKEEFFQKIWPDTFVEDSTLSFNISQLRKILAKFDKEQKFIETVPKRGFRFVGEVREISREGKERTTVLYEKHSTENILLEEIVEIDSDAPILKAIDKNASPAKNSFYLPAAFVGFLILLTAAFVYFWNSGKPPPAAYRIKSIAVLPLKSFANNNNDEELRLRITDALITKLGGLDGISVRPTNSILIFAGEQTDPLEAGRKLEVDAVLDGRIQTEGERLRVTLQLVDVQTGEQIWSGQFDGKADEILNLQDKISARLLPELSNEPTEILAKNPTENAEAYENYLKGRYLWNKRTTTEMKQAVPYFERAIVLDANFAAAYAGLADTYSMLTNFGAFPRIEGYKKAKDIAIKALEIDPNLSEAHSALGWILYIHEWKWAEAENALARATELNPNNAEAHHWRGLNFRAQGKTDEYVVEMEKAHQLAPLTKPIGRNYYEVVLAEEGCDKALVFLEELFALYHMSESDESEMSGAHFDLCGDYNRTIAILEIYPKATSGYKIRAYLAVAYAKTGRRHEAVEILELIKKSDSTAKFYFMSYIHAALGDADAAFADLEKGIEARDDRFTKLKTDAFFAPLHSDARFKILLKKMNLPE